MKFTVAERAVLNGLSKKLYGTASYWRNNFYDKGVARPKEEWKGKKGESSVKYLFTFQDFRQYMLDVEIMREKLMADMKATEETKQNETNSTPVEPTADLTSGSGQVLA